LFWLDGEDKGLKEKIEQLKSSSYFKIMLKSVLVISAIFLMIFIIGSSYIYAYNYKNIIKNTEEQSDYVTANIHVNMQRIMEIMSNLYYGEQLSKYNDMSFDEKKALRQRVGANLTNNTWIDSAIATKNGNVVFMMGQNADSIKEVVLENVTENLLPTPLYAKIDYIDGSDVYKYFYGVVYRDISSGNAIYLTLNESWITNILESFDSSGTVIIINDDTIVASNGKYKINDNVNEYSGFAGILDKLEIKNNFIARFRGDKYIVHREDINEYKWKVIYFSDYSLAVSGYRHFENFIILFMLFIIGATSAVLFMLSKKMHSIISLKVSDDYTQKNIAFLRKQNLLNNMINLHDFFDEEIAEQLLKRYDVSIDINSKLAMILMTYVKPVSEHILRVNEQMIINAADNMGFKIEIVRQLEKNSMIILSGANLHSETLREFLSVIKKSAETEYSCIVSKVFSGINSIILISDELYYFSGVRFLEGKACTVFAEDNFEDTFVYPKDIENAIINSICNYSFEDAYNKFSDIIDVLRKAKCVNGKKIMLQCIINISESVERHGSFSNTDKMKEMAYKMVVAETAEEMQKMFKEFLETIKSNINLNNMDWHDDMVNDIIEFIRSNYDNPELSLTLIADAFQLTSNYIGQIFKRKMKMSAVNYIADVRMEHAKELLKNTDFSVAEIAEKIGIANSNYFYTLFKKKYGMTPNEFRNAVIGD